MLDKVACQALLDQLVQRDQLVLLVNEDNWEIQVQWVQMELRVHQDLLVKVVLPDQVVFLGSQDQLAQQDQLDHPDQMDLKERLEFKVQEVALVMSAQMV